MKMKALLSIAMAASPAAGRLHLQHGITTSSSSRGLQDLVGEDYCTWGPDESCYQNGWPACCQTGRCPIEHPPCELTTTSTTSTPGGNFCDYPDDSCYQNGLPGCCSTGRCPIEAPPCDVSTTVATPPNTPPFTVDEPPPDEPGDGPPGASGAPYCSYEPDFTCYSAGRPTCCEVDPLSCPVDDAKCDVGSSTTTPGTSTPPESPSDTDFPNTGTTELPPLTLPAGGLRACDEVISVVKKEVVLAILEGLLNALAPGLPLGQLMQSVAKYDVRVQKVCTSCEEINGIYGSSASAVMPYCAEGTFQYGRTMSGLLLEPIDPETEEPIVGKVASTIYSIPTDPNPFQAFSERWPSDPATENPGFVLTPALAMASAGTYTIVPDVLGNGEDWESTRSYIVKDVYQASAVPLLLKVKDTIEKTDSCTELDKRVSLMGYSEGGYATIAIAHAIDMLNDGYVHTNTVVGGAPIKYSTVQTYAIVEMHEGTFSYPVYAARLGNSYSSTNPDLANSGTQQDFASDEYLDPTNDMKNLIKWAEAGLSNEEMFALLPFPSSEILNPEFVDLVVSSHDAGNNDPCNSKFAATIDTDQLCQAIKDNDVSGLLESMEYPIVICHSPDDELIYYENVPDTSTNEYLTLIEDIPVLGDLFKPSGTHLEAYGLCSLAFMFPYVADPETSNVRSIMPIDDPDGACSVETTGTSSTVPGDTTTSATTITSAEGTETPTSSPLSASSNLDLSSLNAVTAIALFTFVAHVLW